MKFASLVALSLSATASADSLFRYGEAWSWNGGFAYPVGPGNWVGRGWETFPGVNPPWNSITPPGLEVAPPALVPNPYWTQPYAPVPPPLPFVPVVPAVPAPAYPVVPAMPWAW